MTAEELAEAWRTAKSREELAREERYEIERQLLELHKPRPEGTKTVTLGNGAKMTLVQKMTYRIDHEKLAALTHDWPTDSKPFKKVIVPDETLLKHIRLEMPRQWNHIAPAIEVKPAKVNVSFKWGDE
jgi:hypothetical protein